MCVKLVKVTWAFPLFKAFLKMLSINSRFFARISHEILFISLSLFISSDRNSSVGVLEMGGGSTQIVFIPKLPIYANKFIIHIGSQYYQTYAHSYLNFGQRYIIERVTSFLIKKHHQTSKPYSRINDPCRLKGKDDY